MYMLSVKCLLNLESLQAEIIHIRSESTKNTKVIVFKIFAIN